MTGLLDAFGHNLRNVTRFDGRDTRPQFWFYMLGLFLAQQAFSVLIGLVVLAGLSLGGGGGESQAAVDYGSMRAPVQMLVTGSLMLGAVAIALLAASIARRLHDSGLSGWWGAMPLPFLMVGMVGFYLLSRDLDRPGTPFNERTFNFVFVNNGVYLLALLALIVLLVRPSDPVANRYGAPPAG